MPIRVASLLRLSTKSQAKRQGEGEPDIPAQREEIAKFIAGKDGWTLVKEFVEAGVSAYRKGRRDREELNRILQDAEDGAFDVLLLWKGDRLSRRIEDFPSLIKDFSDLGVQVWSVVDAPGGKQWTANNALEMLLLSVEGFKNESESENTSIRTKTRKRQLAAEGHWGGGRVPYGYRLVARIGADGQPVLLGGRVVREVVPDPDTAPIVRRIYESYLCGMGCAKIAGLLNSESVPCSGGAAEWSAQVVRHILNSAFYTGLLQYGRSARGRAAVGTVIEANGSHEPLISQDTWEAVQKLRSSKSGLHPRQRGSTRIFSGLLHCPYCGGIVGAAKSQWNTKTGGLKEVLGMRCQRYVQSGSCRSVFYRESDLDQSFGIVLDELCAPDGIQQLLKEHEQAQAHKHADATAERDRQKQRLTEVTAALKRLDAAYFEKGLIDDDEYREKKGAYHAQRDELTDRLGEPIPTEDVGNVSELALQAKELRMNWEYLELEEKKAYVLGIVKGWHLRLVADKDESGRAYIKATYAVAETETLS